MQLHESSGVQTLRLCSRCPADSKAEVVRAGSWPPPAPIVQWVQPRCGLSWLLAKAAQAPVPPAHTSTSLSLPFPQLGANALLFVCVNVYGVFLRVLAERCQRKAFLQARNCIEDRLRLEDENEKQVSAKDTFVQGCGGAGEGTREWAPPSEEPSRNHIAGSRASSAAGRALWASPPPGSMTAALGLPGVLTPLCRGEGL